MYESPIEMIIGKMQTQMDDDVVKAVQSYHINVDKDELVKALRYDRDQYKKGYADGKRDAERMHGKWLNYYGDEVQLDSEGRSQDECYCSVCGDFLSASDEYSCRGYYCPNCGASMQTEKKAERS